MNWLRFYKDEILLVVVGIQLLTAVLAWLYYQEPRKNPCLEPEHRNEQCVSG
jgi:hypothetical protein